MWNTYITKKNGIFVETSIIFSFTIKYQTLNTKAEYTSLVAKLLEMNNVERDRNWININRAHPLYLLQNSISRLWTLLWIHFCTI